MTRLPRLALFSVFLINVAGCMVEGAPGARESRAATEPMQAQPPAAIEPAACEQEIRMTEPACPNLPTPCGAVRFVTSFGPEDGVGEYVEHRQFVDIDDVKCVLLVLAAGEPASITIISENASEAIGDNQTIEIVDGGQAFVRGNPVYDDWFYEFIQRRQLLKPAEHFEHCLTLTDEDELKACLWNWSDGCGDSVLGCPVTIDADG